MRMPWHRSKDALLELLDAESELNARHRPAASTPHTYAASPPPQAIMKPGIAWDSRPLMLAITWLVEDPANPRTEFPAAALDELAEDIRQRGILQPLVVHPADGEGRHRIHFGAERLRAAIRAGLHEVPVVVRDLPADRYAQVAENQKRHGLTSLELARFIRAQVDAGDSNATIASQLGMNLTAVAHHLSLLELPPVLDDVLKSGLCTSPARCTN
jgi:ParB family transcriptional regulator, chromosome partitioning protein